MSNITPKFVRPRNSERVADAVYWFLRSAQSIVQIGEPRILPSLPPTISKLALLDPHERKLLAPKAVLPAPSLENRFIVLDQDERHVHLLGGPHLNFGQSFVVNEGGILAAAVSNESLFLLRSDGELLQIALFQLVRRVSAIASPPVPLRGLHCVSLRDAWAMDSCAPPAMVCPLTANKDAVLLFDPALERVSLVEAMGAHLSRRPISLALSHQLRASLQVGCAIGLDARVLFLDRWGSRLYLLDPFERQPRLRPFAGEGEPTSRSVGYGEVAIDGRVLPAKTMARYSLSPRVVETVASCLRFDFEDPEHRKAAAKHLPHQPEDVERLKRHVLGQAGFLVLYEPESGMVATCSLPLQDVAARRILPVGPPQLLPLAGSHATGLPQVFDPFAGLPPMLRGLSEVVQGPESSLMFWHPGESSVVMLQALGETFGRLLDNKAHMDELNKLLGRRPEPRDSN